MTQVPEGWHPDPTSRYSLRWWDGEQWTDHVHHDGQTFSDSLEAALAAAAKEAASGENAATAEDDDETATPATADGVTDAGDVPGSDGPGRLRDGAPSTGDTDATTGDGGVSAVATLEEVAGTRVGTPRRVEDLSGGARGGGDDAGDVPAAEEVDGTRPSADAVAVVPDDAAGADASSDPAHVTDGAVAGPSAGPGGDDLALATDDAGPDARDPDPDRPRLLGALVDGSRHLRSGGAVQAQSPHLLRVRVHDGSGLHARRSGIALRRGEVTATPDGDTFVAVAGTGDVLLGDAGREVHVVELDDTVVRVAGSALLAWSDGIDAVRVAGGAHRLTGTGWVALTTRGVPVTLAADPSTVVPRRSLVLWTAEARDDGTGGEVAFHEACLVVVQP